VVADPVSSGDLIDPVHEAAKAADDTLLVYYPGHGLIDHNTNELLLADAPIWPDLAEVVRQALDDQYPTAADRRDALSRL
jgi:hypothetical protein